MKGLLFTIVFVVIAIAPLALAPTAKASGMDYVVVEVTLDGHPLPGATVWWGSWGTQRGFVNLQGNPRSFTDEFGKASQPYWGNTMPMVRVDVYLGENIFSLRRKDQRLDAPK